MRKVILSHPFGNPFSYNATLAFQEMECLDAFWTSLFRPLGMRKRYHPGLKPELIRTRSIPELIRLATTLLPYGPWNGRSPNWADRAWRGFDKYVAHKLSASADAVYAYEDGAYHTFSRARELGLATIYELPIAHFEAGRLIYEEEAQRHPELVPWMQVLHEPHEKLLRKRAELDLADVIVTPSTFVRESILAHHNVTAPIVIVPYGCDISVSPKIHKGISGPIKLFFAGVLDPRKGIHYLFEALSELDPMAFELTVAGRWTPGFREWLDRRFTVGYNYLGQVEHSRLIGVYHDYDLFVFPTLHEGFGLVLLEAMAAGIPIASTVRSGAPDIIQDGREGFLFPAASAEGLRQTLQRALSMRDALPEMGRLARVRAETLSWARYRQTLFESLAPYLNPN